TKAFDILLKTSWSVSVSLGKEFYVTRTYAKFMRLLCTDPHLAQSNQLKHRREIIPIAINLSLGSGVDNFLTRN
ncbi:hypothetical protein, partial [Undibacterium sp.]|uniref:hypothetical protein n=1 Tax=Undibacterium sp. TaxID=1914977 RepID=UPI003750EE0F